jgi:hypothetical protein
MSTRRERRHINTLPVRTKPMQKAEGTKDTTFHEPKEFGPNYKHNLAGKNHFADGGHAAGGMWVANAFNPSNKGKLHESLHIPKGRKIPVARLEKAEHSDNPLLRKRANLAMTARSFQHRHQGR